MEVKRIIIHELIKEPKKSGDVTYKSSSNLIKVTPGINKLIDLIHLAFEQSITKYSKFDTANKNNSVYHNIDKYLKKDTSNNQFIEFSKTSLSDLVKLIEREPFATGGFYLFVDYLQNGLNYISIIIARNKDAFNIKWDGDDFVVDTTENINIDKLAMGFRINSGLYLDDSDSRNYLALISHQGDDLSKYFIKWVNAEQIIDSRTNTRQLINIIKELGPPKDYGSVDDFEKDIHDWIEAFRKSNDNTINIDLLSEAIYKDKLYIRNSSQVILKRELDPVFKVSGSELRKLIWYQATSKGIKVSIDVEKFHNRDVRLEDGLLIIKCFDPYKTRVFF